MFKDPRKGYWKHAVIQLTWNIPTRGELLLYEICQVEDITSLQSLLPNHLLGSDVLDHYEIILQLDPQYDQPYCKSVAMATSDKVCNCKHN